MPISLTHCKNSRKQSFISTTYIAFYYTISLILFGMSSVLCPAAGAAHTIAKARLGICSYLFSDFHTNSEGPRDSAVSYLSKLQPLGTVTTASHNTAGLRNCRSSTTTHSKLFTATIPVDSIPTNYTPPKHLTKFYSSTASAHPPSPDNFKGGAQDAVTRSQSRRQ